MRLSVIGLALLLGTGTAGCGSDGAATADGATTSATRSTAAPATSRGVPPDKAPRTRSATPSPTAALTTAAPAPSPSAADPVLLTGRGVDLPTQLLAFGSPYDGARPPLDVAFGEPTRDEGVESSFSGYGTCPGTQLRALEYGDGALVLLFGDVDGPGLTLYQWALSLDGTPDDVPRASALVGDVTTYEFGVGTGLRDLREGAGDAVTVQEADEVFAPSFELADQSPGLFGQLTGTGDDDTVTFVQAGQACGE